MALLGHPERF
jgi:hypothetical protein